MTSVCQTVTFRDELFTDHCSSTAKYCGLITLVNPLI